MGRMRFGIILAILTMVVTIGACRPGEEATPTPASPRSDVNRPPVILTLRPAQQQTYPSGIIHIEYIATDPDGDSISYDWSTTGGNFMRSGNAISWVAPEYYGFYDITLTVKDGKGGITERTIALSVVANQNPQVLSLVADPTTVAPQGRSSITCAAMDPDGDKVEYSWQADYGSITGLGNKVTWLAPDREGDFTITVVVNDDKGGQDVAYIRVTVALPEKAITFNLLPTESGTVSSDGSKDNSNLLAGDSDGDIGYRTFLSFDISQLKGTDIRDAELTLRLGTIIGDPFSKEMAGLGGLRLWRVRGEYGQLPNYDTQTTALAEASSVMWESPTAIDLTNEVRNALKSPEFSIRLQFQASFLRTTNYNHFAEYVRWSVATLTVSYVEK